MWRRAKVRAEGMAMMYKTGVNISFPLCDEVYTTGVTAKAGLH